MIQTPAKPPPKHLRASDLRAVAQLASQAPSGVSHIVEGKGIDTALVKLLPVLATWRCQPPRQLRT